MPKSSGNLSTQTAHTYENKRIDCLGNIGEDEEDFINRLYFIMRIGVLTTCFLFFFSSSALANYSQSKTWFYSQSYEDRITLQLLLIFTGDYVAIVDATFGKRTYDALLNFQFRNGFPPDGTLDEREIDQLMTDGGSVMEKVGFEFRDEPTTGITLGIPESLFTAMEPTRRGIRWTAKDQLIELETLRIPHYDTGYQQLFRRLSTETRNRRIEYKLFRNDYFIVSGTNRGKDFYLRVFRTGRDTRGFSLSWDNKVSALMDRVAVAMSNSLTYFDGSRQANRPQLPSARNSDRAIPAPSTQPKRTRSSGSGYFLSDQGHVGTNFHVVEDCSRLEVSGFGSAKVIKKDELNDLAIIQINKGEVPGFAKFRPLPVRRGEAVYVLGFPLSNILGDSLTISEGIVSSLSGIAGDVRHFSLSAPVQPGNSGGPVLDSSGLVIGTVVAKLDAMKTLEVAGTLPENINFAVQGNMMATLMASANIEPTFTIEEEAMTSADVASAAEIFTVQIICNPN